MIDTKTKRITDELTCFSDFSDQARIWIYQSSQSLTEEQIGKIEEELERFTQSWSAHNVQLKASSKVIFSTFIVLSVDEEPHVISGCGIDKSVHKINELEQSLGLSLIDRAHMCILEASAMRQIPIAQISTAYESSNLKVDTIVCNTMIQSLGELRTRFLIPFEQSPFFRLA